ncbi:MAG: alpha/beta hydrolase [Coriobacteriales bacterium]|jgi:pimeloyl-ACP methyl ester carboxylesterase|nr:alpha/beta hydrolase [Coriobacteriales bacterium]
MGLRLIGGAQVNVIEMGPEDAPPLIMIHGLFSNLSLYYFIIAPELAKDHHVVLYDLRGHGTSECRDEGYTLEILSADLLALMDSLGITQADIVAYSYGGTAALYTAVTHPEAVRRLVLIDTPMLNEPEIERLGASGTDDGLIEYMLREYSAETDFFLSDSKKRQVREKWHRLFDDGLLAAALRDGYAYLERLPLEQLAASTLLMYGNQSSLLTTGQELARRIPQAELLTTDGDHNLPILVPYWVCEKLQEFFKQPT